MYKQITGKQIRAARALLEWSQQKLGEEASLSQSPIASMEKDVKKSRESTVRLVIKTLEEAGIEFINRPDGMIGVLLLPNSSALDEQIDENKHHTGHSSNL